MKSNNGSQKNELMCDAVVPAWQHILLRGGRLIKHAGQVVSLSPSFGTIMGAASVSPIALGAALTFGAPSLATAGTCTVAASGEYVCSDSADSSTDTTLTFTDAESIVTQDGFGIATTSGSAFDIIVSDDFTFTDNYESSIEGNYSGIVVNDNGNDADISITSTGTVTGDTENGIYVYSSGGGDVSVSAANVSGYNAAIRVDNVDDGDVSVTTTGTVSSTNNSGVRITNDGDGDVTVTTVDVSGGADGISIDTAGDGDVTVVSTGTVTGETDQGIQVNTDGDGDVSITAADVSGYESGIYAYSEGAGDVTITSTGTASGEEEHGIYAYNESGDISITAVDVSGYSAAISAETRDGDLTITTTGTVVSDYNPGIRALAAGVSSDLTISVVDVTGGSDGINAQNDGTGELTITSTGTVTGVTDNGIQALNYGTDLTITTVDVSGADSGIYATNSGTGDLTITATGTVTGEADNGILAYNEGADVTVTAVDVSGGTYGIQAYNIGTGDVTITSTGTVTGETENGIEVYNTGGDVTITAADVSGYTSGIRVINVSDGEINITSTGTVTSTNVAGIRVTNSGDGDVAVTAVDVSGYTSGIVVETTGDSNLTITSTGSVTGETARGINASAEDGSITITAVDIDSYNDAISAIATSGDVNVDVSGTVYSSNGTAIETDTTGLSTITLASGADVSAGTGDAISNGDGDSVVTVEDGASLAGAISLGGGSDSLSFDGTDFSDVTSIDGGDDDDTVSFYGKTALSSDLLSNWEEVVVGEDANLTFTNSTLEVATLTVDAGGTLDVTEGFNLTGDLFNSGTLDAVDGDTADTISITGDYSGSGEVAIDVDSETNTADTLYIDGDVTSTETTYIAVNDATSSGDEAASDIVVVEVTGTVDADDFALSDDVVGVYTYDLSFDQDSFYLSSEFNSNGGVYQNYTDTVLSFLVNESLSNVRANRTWLSVDETVSRGAGNSVAPQEGAWVLVQATKTNVSPNASYTQRYETNVYEISLGYDLKALQTSNGDWTFGIVGDYGVSSTDLTFSNGTGTIDSQKYLIGATAWLEDQNRYFGAQAKVGFVNSDVASSTSGTLIEDHRSAAVVLGVEAGHRFELAEGSAIIPQAELSYVYLDGGELVDNDNNDVSFSSSESLTARIGMAYEFDMSDSALSDDKGYVIGSLIHSFSGMNDINVGNTELSSDAEGSWAEIGAGASFELSGGSEMFVEASYLFDVGSSTDDTESFNLKAGWNLKW